MQENTVNFARLKKEPGGRGGCMLSPAIGQQGSCFLLSPLLCYFSTNRKPTTATNQWGIPPEAQGLHYWMFLLTCLGILTWGFQQKDECSILWVWIFPDLLQLVLPMFHSISKSKSNFLHAIKFRRNNKKSSFLCLWFCFVLFSQSMTLYV